MNRGPRLPLALVLLLAAFVAFMPGQAGAAPAKRVVALEWNYAEDLLALGVKPVGIADIAGMKAWTPVSPPSGIKDVGTRAEPSLERIAALRPDLIVVPRFRGVRNLDDLREIAKVVVLQSYPSSRRQGAQYDAMIGELRAIATAVGKRARADAIVRDLDREYLDLRKQLSRANRDGLSVTLAMAGGTPDSPALRVFTRNSIAAGVLSRLGLRNAWTGQPERYGFSTVGIEALRQVQSSWMVFAYPRQYDSVIRRMQEQSAWSELEFVREGHVRAIPGNTWPYGGPLATKVLAQRIVGALVR